MSNPAGCSKSLAKFSISTSKTSNGPWPVCLSPLGRHGYLPASPLKTTRLWRTHLARTNGPVSLGNHIMRVRAFLNWCKREKIISEIPAGDSLKKPSRPTAPRPAARGSRMFTPEEIRQLIQCASPQLRAMILLALNAGLGNNDLALLETKHIQGKWLVYPRPKTGIERRVPFWPESRKADLRP